MQRIELPFLETQWMGRDAWYLQSVDSTNNFCKEKASQLTHGAVVLAREQTAGRGRRGHTWCVPPGQSLSMSVLLHQVTLPDMPVLPLLCGLAVARAFPSMTLKWPNDGLLGDKKAVGILCESRIGSDAHHAVCGIGVNLLQEPQAFGAEGLEHAGSLLSETGERCEPLAAAGKILTQLERVWEEYRQMGFCELRAQYSECCVTLGREVRVTDGPREYTGFAREIGEDGSLICLVGDEVRAVRAGETSVRGLMGYA